MTQKTKKVRMQNQLSSGLSTITILLSGVAIALTYWGLSFHNEKATNGYSLKKYKINDMKHYLQLNYWKWK